MPDLLLARVRMLLEQAHCREHHARRAIAALEAVVDVEGLLNGMEPTVLRQALDRPHLVPVGLDGEDGARLDRLAVEEDGAGAARGRVAPDRRSGQAELLPQEVDEELARLDLHFRSAVVDGDGYRSHCGLLRKRRAILRRSAPRKRAS